MDGLFCFTVFFNDIAIAIAVQIDGCPELRAFQLDIIDDGGLAGDFGDSKNGLAGILPIERVYQVVRQLLCGVVAHRSVEFSLFTIGDPGKDPVLYKIDDVRAGFLVPIDLFCGGEVRAKGLL